MEKKFIHLYSVKRSLSIILLLALVSCVSKRKDTEVSFHLSFIPVSTAAKDSSFCFDEARASGKEQFSDRCIDSLHSEMSLPLDINRDSSRFIFRTGNRWDTLDLRYKRAVIRDEQDYTMGVKKILIDHSTFDSIKVNHSNSQGNEIKSITVYF